MTTLPRRSPPLLSIALVTALLVFIFGTVSPRVLSDPDTLWHVAAGRWMVEHHALPTQDMFSHSMPGKAWVAHEWGSELLMYGVHAVAGFAGLTVLASLCFALTAGYLLRFLLQRMEPIHVLPSAMIYLSVINTHFLARPHVLVWPLMAVWIGTLVQCVDTDRRPPWWLLALLVLWANLHASFTFGLGMAGALAMDALWQQPTHDGRVSALKRWLPFGLGCLFAMACNPHGYGSLIHAGQLMSMKTTLAMIGEWQSTNFQEFQFLLLWIVMVLPLAFTGRLRLSFVRALLMIGLIYMALKHVRYHSVLALASAFLLATPMARGLHRLEATESSAIDHWMRYVAQPARRFGVLLTLLISILYTAIARPAIRHEPDRKITPEKALAAFTVTGIKARVLNGYAYGGFLIYRGIPVFVDGRADMYGDLFMSEVADALTLRVPDSIEQLTRKYQIGWTLLAANSAATQMLDHLPGWTRFYSDSIAVIHVRQALLDSARVTAPRAAISHAPDAPPTAPEAPAENPSDALLIRRDGSTPSAAARTQAR